MWNEVARLPRLRRNNQRKIKKRVSSVTKSVSKDGKRLNKAEMLPLCLLLSMREASITSMRAICEGKELDAEQK